MSRRKRGIKTKKTSLSLTVDLCNVMDANLNNKSEFSEYAIRKEMKKRGYL